MKVFLKRQFNTDRLATGNYTFGFMHNEVNSFRSFALEDDFNAEKIPGSTRIPAGIYELGIRTVETDALRRHRVSYADLPWFKDHPDWRHIEILKVPNYSGVLIHSGNDDKDTLGCVLPAYTFDLTAIDNQSGKSKLAVNDFYAIHYPLLEASSKVHLIISDEQ